MLGHLVRKEILDHISSPRFIILSALGALIILASLFSGYTHYQAQVRDYRLGQAMAEGRVRQLVDTDHVLDDLTEVDMVGFIDKPPTPMSIFVQGLDPVLGRSGNLGSYDKTPRLKWSPSEVRPDLGVFLPLDLSLVVQVLLSLFVFLLTYDAVCGEKEAGTLRLMASFPAPRHLVLAGKVLGAIVPTLTAFGLPMLFGLGVLALAPDVRFTGPELGRLGLVFLAFGLYLATCTCGGVLASCLTHRAAASFVLLLGFWVIASEMLPRLSLIVADGLRPAPSTYELLTEKETVSKKIAERQRDLREQWRQEHSRPGQEWWKTPEGREAWFLFNEKVSYEISGAVQSQHDRLDEAFRNRYDARLSLAVALARLSPAFELKNAAVVLAGTGMDRHRRFFEACSQHRKRHALYYLEVYYGTNLRRAHPAKYGAYKWDAAGLPRFTYHDPWPRAEAQTALIDIGMLSLWGVLSFGGAWVAVLRYDLR